MNGLLIVDDDPEGGEILAELLEQAGFAVDRADDAHRALEILRHRRPLPSLILLDLMMPRMDGRQFREEQKKDPDLAKISIIAISGAKASSRDLMEIAAAGYVRKPLSITKLLEMIEQVLGGRQ